MRTPRKSQTERVNPLGLLTITQAMDMVRMSRASFDRWRRRHHLPYTCGKQIHIDDINAVIARERGLSQK